MKVLLCCLLLSFCVIILGHKRPRFQMIMNGPIEKCPDFEDEQRIDLTELRFKPTSDDNVAVTGKFSIKQNINAPIAIGIKSYKYERGTWVNSMLNQNIKDVCKEMAKEKRPDWMKIFDQWTADGKCPFITKDGEYQDLVLYNSLKSAALLPPSLYGKYKSESRFQTQMDGEMVDIGCYIVHFEIASV